MEESLEDQRGRRVREVWVVWAKEQPDCKPSWLVGGDDLDEGQREVDRRIGAALWGDGIMAGYNAGIEAGAWLAGGDEDLPASGAGLIAIERHRQVIQEGWTAEHDAEHINGELAIAGVLYALPEPLREQRILRDLFMSAVNWAAGWFKPRTRVEDLVRAGALMAAEIDRLKAEATR